MRGWTKLLMLLVAVLLSAACATHSTTTEAEGDSSAYEQTYEQTNFYYEFEDILIPKELTPVDDEKYVFDDGRFLAGFRIFSGRVVADDVFQFFLNNMQRDGWTKTVSIKSDESMLVFSKPNRSCTIKIEDGFKTTVTVFAVQLRTSQSYDVQVQDLN